MQYNGFLYLGMRRLIFVFALALLGSCVESNSDESASLIVYEDEFTGQTVIKDSEESNLITVDENGFVNFKNQLFNGTEKGFYPVSKISGKEKKDKSRNLEYEGSYKDGIREGLWKWWYENEQLSIEAYYKNGKLEGFYRAWHNNGQLLLETNYKSGEENGVFKRWYESGQLKEQGINKIGIAEGLYREWHENGQLMREANLKEGYADGLSKIWHENGILANEVNHKDRYMNGLYRMWDENGKLKVKGNYKEGRLDGVWENYNEERDPIRIENYRLGELMETKTHSSFYENGKIKLEGPGFDHFNRYFVNYTSGLELKYEPNLNSNDLTHIAYNTEVFLISKTGLHIIINDTTEVVGNTRLINGEWLNAELEIELKPGDEGYYFDEIEGPSRKMIAGYVIDEFLDVEIDSIKKSGVWSTYYETGQINKEELYFDNRIIKAITYYKNGNIAEIIEYRNDYFWEGSVSKSFYENGNIKSIGDVEGGGAVGVSFDENGEYEGGWDYSGMKDHFDNIVLSKNIKEFFLPENKDIDRDLFYN